MFEKCNAIKILIKIDKMLILSIKSILMTVKKKIHMINKINLKYNEDGPIKE